MGSVSENKSLKLHHDGLNAIPIVMDEEFMHKPCENATLEEAEKIWPLLFQSLEGRQGWGMAANQIGIQKRVAVIVYGAKQIKLLNPRIVELNDPIVYSGEGCFSIPGRVANTVRYRSVVFQNEENGEMRTYYITDQDGALPFVVQHEIDHLDGKWMLDRRQKPIKLEPRQKIGRNEPCGCGSGKKYKKCCLGGLK